MRWEESLLELFEDLEQQASGMALEERDLEVADRAQAEYLRVDVVSRWMASVGCEVRLRLPGLGALGGRVARVGVDWCLLEPGGGDTGAFDWVVPLSSVVSVLGLSERSVHREAWPVTARLSLGSVLRRMGEERVPVQVHLTDGGREAGPLGRVGADFVELEGAAGVLAIPFTSLSALRASG